MKDATKGDGVRFSAESSTAYSEWALQHGGEISVMLLSWFDRSARNLPWRSVRDPYRVLLSELMLQQTQVATVIPYYKRFLLQWPTLLDLAGADDQAVLKAWEGLGYYSRARNLLAAVRAVVEQHDGVIPCGEKDLLQLKGIGEYTAGAIRSIAFGLPAAAVDGNVVRVFSRLTATTWQPADLAHRRQVRTLVEKVIPPDRPGDFNEALMDLGATICLPQNPVCADCPVRSSCRAFETASVARFPDKKPAREKPVEQRTCLMITKGGLVHVNRRPDHGLLAGLYEFDWHDGALPLLSAGWPAVRTELGQLRHVFTHKIWLVDGLRIDLMVNPDTNWPDHFDDPGRWVGPDELKTLPFPKVLIQWRDDLVVALSSV
ncbi:MAG: A/G-specific adenine glycosylase [Clostridia bacterium]|nr:A/G-specific adenine glycosylase [Clostridia bacterium]